MDLADLSAIKDWLKKSEAQRAKDPRYDEMVVLLQKVWDQWQIAFMNGDKDMQHPFRNDRFVRRQRESYEPETFKKERHG